MRLSMNLDDDDDDNNVEMVFNRRMKRDGLRSNEPPPSLKTILSHKISMAGE